MLNDLNKNIDPLNISALNEFEIPTPLRIDQDITAGNKSNINDPETVKYRNEDFDRNEKNKKIINDDKNDTFEKDSKWQDEKMHETKDQQGDKLNPDNSADEKNSIDRTDKDTKPKDTETKMADAKEAREDSILFKPKTETYETKKDEDMGTQLKKENYTHTEEERKRDELNRKNKSNKENNTEHTF